LSFPLASSFPAKTIDLGAIAVVYTVEIRDTVEVVDYIGVKADFVKALAEVGVPCDYLERTVTFNVNIYDIYEGIDYLERTVTFHIDLAEVGIACDYVCKDVLKPLVDVGIPCEWFTKSKGYLRVLRDYAVGEYWTIPTWGAIREFIDVAKTLDYIYKDVSKSLLDAGKTVDWYSKTITFHIDLVDILESLDWLMKTLEKNVYDYAIGEYWLVPARQIFKEYVDSAKTLDYMCKDVLKPLVDVGIPRDFLEKTLLKTLLDTGILCDWYSKGIVRTFEYESVSTGWVEKTVHYYKDLVEVVESIDWRGAFDILRGFKESVILRDVPARILSLVLMDTLVGEYSIARGIAQTLKDKGKPKDLATKIDYKIYGYDVRRAYMIREWLLHERRELIDYIMPEDHNIRIEIAKCLLEAMKRIKEKIEE